MKFKLFAGNIVSVKAFLPGVCEVFRVVSVGKKFKLYEGRENNILRI